MGTKNQRAVNVWVNISDDLVRFFFVFFFLFFFCFCFFFQRPGI